MLKASGGKPNLKPYNNVDTAIVYTAIIAMFDLVLADS